VKAALEGAGIVPAERSAETDEPQKCGLLVVHVAADLVSTGSYYAPGVELWLEQAERDGASVVFTVPQVTPGFVRDVFLPRGLALVVRTDPLEAAAVTALVELCRAAVTPPAPPAPDDVAIGARFHPALSSGVDEAAAYEAARSLSLLGPSMTAFMSELSDVTRSLLAHIPPKIPWDPDDLQPSSLRRAPDGSVELRATGRPNLREVFEAHGAPAARALLRNRPEDLAEPVPHPPAVLVLGESGTGKSLVAATFHEQLARATRRRHGDVPVPFVSVNCGGMPADNFDHLMFGGAAGHFTDVGVAVGWVARAAYGTVFFDEIGDLSLEAQQRLLTFLDHRRVTPHGIASYPSHIHVVAATNRDLATLVAQGRFRHDLLSRFAAQLTIPPLRDRDTDELRTLVDFVACNPFANPDRRVTHVSAAAMARLEAMRYREGNFRELESIVHAGLRQAIRRQSATLEASDIDSWEESFVPDALERVVRVDADLPPAAGDVPVHSVREIHRMAHLLGRPLLHTPCGDLVLHDGATVFRRSVSD
jgi:hypothetical protein